MEIDQLKLQLLKQAVERTFGRPLGAPTDFDALSAQILSSTGRTLGVSTLKRLWGYVTSSHTPSYSTLSILARYVGFHDWHSFCSHFHDLDDSGFSKEGMIIAAELEIGATIRAEWNGDKVCSLRKIAQPARFEVVEAKNIKLNPGDTMTIDTLSVGQKLIATDCLRAGRALGTYTGATKDGIIALTQL
ncbi:MAG: hypothetical protein K2K82_08200 [Muribaculaceae bacterium]|nr:hypothetical protein [Muribaculaceae bacterium]